MWIPGIVIGAAALVLAIALLAWPAAFAGLFASADRARGGEQRFTPGKIRAPGIVLLVIALVFLALSLFAHSA
jgi:hypothetical protein